MTLLLFNYSMDKKYAPHAFTIDWVNEFSLHCDRVIVLTLRVGEIEVNKNVVVYDIGHNVNSNKLLLIIKFYSTLLFILLKYKINGVFSHMNQLFSALGGLPIRIMNKDLVTWYAHPSVTISLRIANMFSNKIVTSIYGAYPIKTNKLHIIGQGIDIDKFKQIKCAKEKVILYVGRVSRSKKIETLVNAFKLIEKEKPEYKVYIYGDVIERDGSDYFKELISLVQDNNLTEKVLFFPAVNRDSLPKYYSSAEIFINLTPIGFGDKVAFEAMACQTPTLVANTGMIETLGKFKNQCLFEFSNDLDLAEKILYILNLPDLEKVEMGKYLRNKIVEIHNIKNIPYRVLDLLK
jgi:glycosyltransferase involved in cell wall biosynthesis